MPDIPVAAAHQPQAQFRAFFANFGPNGGDQKFDAVKFLISSIWPEVRKKCPELRLRLVGRGDRYIRHLLPSGLNIEVTGPIDDALAAIAAARIVLAPLRSGSGTRIKILEAW